jgi:hypothetical protein
MSYNKGNMVSVRYGFLERLQEIAGDLGEKRGKK